MEFAWVKRSNTDLNIRARILDLNAAALLATSRGLGAMGGAAFEGFYFLRCWLCLISVLYWTGFVRHASFVGFI
jgi:hypothetical protein